ncbi:hypothetical protein [Fulvivirga imtechensis]|uniref:hypothetical protein n=1 Tax=Fulvivirga imtechensis TaxID=881893 RepID=UPI00058B16B0|nr:hypothetical protein [Fulvivirga imtechensis]
MNKEFIRIRNWPTDHAEKAYKDGNYIEALQVLHGWIESRFQELLHLYGVIDCKQDSEKIWDIVNQINFINSAKVLYILNILSENEYQQSVKFNSTRNQLIHKIFHEPYEKIYEGIPKKEYDNVFKQGLKLADIIQLKVEKKV